MTLKLYSYWRSSAAYRVRIALNLKGAAFETEAVNIAPDVLAQQSAAYRAVNPQMRVPSLDVDGQVLTQSMAILEWIEETLPGPSLLPDGPLARARCRAFAQTIVSDIHPIQNSSVLAWLRGELALGEDGVRAWAQEWMHRGFAALEVLAAGQGQGDFLFGEAPTFAEICLVPQLYNARRFGVDLGAYPRLVALDEAVHSLPAFAAAAPEVQPDAA